MSIYRRPRSPYFWYSFTVNSRRFRGSTQTADRETARLIAASVERKALLEGVTGKKPEMTLDAAVGRYWLEHASALPSAYTLDYQLENLLTGLGKDLRLHQLADNDVAQYVARRRADVSDASVNREITLLRAVLRMARDRWGVEVAMPNFKAQWLREPAPRQRYLTVDEADKLIAAAAPHLKPAIELSLLTGIRLSNCIGLDWSQVRLPEREMIIMVKAPTPGGKPHSVPLSEPVVVLLANLGPKDAGPVFTYRGRPIKSWRRAWRNALKRARILNFRWHDLRHTAASWMLEAGVPLDVVQRVLAHADIQTTLRYAHRADTAQRTAVNAVASHWRHTSLEDDEEEVERKGIKRV